MDLLMAARQPKTPVDKNSPEYLSQQISSGRGTLLGIIILTALNEVMLQWTPGGTSCFPPPSPIT